MLTFVLRQGIGNDAPLVAAFWGLLVAILVVSLVVTDGHRFRRGLQMLLVAATLAGCVGFILAL